MTWIDDVIGFWYRELRPKDWWSAAPEVDRRIHDRFGTLHATLVAQPPAVASLDARGHLAAVLVYDQFSRNLFRDSARAFATDTLALSITLDAIHRGLDAVLDGGGRQFLYMPLMHSEDPAMQRCSLERFGTIDDADALRSARRHRASIERFGRFPTRNAALGRPSTPDELAYLRKHARG